MFGRRRFSPGGWGECVSRAQVRPDGHPAHRRRGPLTGLRVVQLEARFCSGYSVSESVALFCHGFVYVDIADCIDFDSTCGVLLSMLNPCVNQLRTKFSGVVMILL